MKPEDYLEKSKEVRMVLVGEKDTYEKTANVLERPDEEIMEGICKENKKGKVTFTDQITFLFDKKDTIHSYELYYSGKQISFREAPGIDVRGDDALELTWILTIEQDSGVVIGAEL